MNRTQASPARAAWVCWAIASDTRTAKGSLRSAKRKGSSMPLVPAKDGVAGGGRERERVGHAATILDQDAIGPGFRPGGRALPSAATRLQSGSVSAAEEPFSGDRPRIRSRRRRVACEHGRVTKPAASGVIDGTPRADIRDEAERVAHGALAAGLQLRLMGGMAVYLTSPTVRRPPYARDYGDFDFAVSARDTRAATAFFEGAGYAAEKMFNALHGAQRLNFRHPERGWPIDVIVDEVRMSHRIDLRGRLNGPGPTLTLADLLLTKLQIWEINPKDLGDIVCVLADHELADGEGIDVIDCRRILGLAGTDWGLCRTLRAQPRPDDRGGHATGAGRAGVRPDRTGGVPPRGDRCRSEVAQVAGPRQDRGTGALVRDARRGPPLAVAGRCG